MTTTVFIRHDGPEHKAIKVTVSNNFRREGVTQGTSEHDPSTDTDHILAKGDVAEIHVYDQRSITITEVAK